MAVITEHDLSIMDRRRRLRDGHEIEYVPSPEELRQTEARRGILEREVAEQERRYKPRSGAISPKEVAEHVGLTAAEFERLSPGERLAAMNSLEFARSTE